MEKEKLDKLLELNSRIISLRNIYRVITNEGTFLNYVNYDEVDRGKDDYAGYYPICMDDDDSEVFFEFIRRHKEMIREEVKRDIERCFEEIKNLQS